MTATILKTNIKQMIKYPSLSGRSEPIKSIKFCNKTGVINCHTIESKLNGKIFKYGYKQTLPIIRANDIDEESDLSL